jgi:uncharacterized protein (TIGR02996 family)
MDSDRRALIAAIRAAPEDDTPRLVCADWFEEQGDEASVARAEFIRTQVARARLAVDDPQQSELQARELRLLKRHAAAWCGSHFLFKKVRFRRGFIEYVHLHLTHFLHHRRQLLALEPVRDVSLTGWMRATDDLVRRVAACEEWNAIESLRIHHQGPHKDPGDPLVLLLDSPHLTRLRSLRVSRISITAEARRRFERAPVLGRLTELTLPDLDSFPDDPGEWLSGRSPPRSWESLRSLRLPGYMVNTGLLARLTRMPFWNKLTALDLSLGWGHEGVVAAVRDRLPDSLRTLRLSLELAADPNPLGPLLERAGELPLQGLHLNRVEALNPAALRHVLGDDSRCELRDLSLSECNLTEAHIRAVGGSAGAQRLRSLDLSRNWQFSPVAARALFASENLRSLVELNLESTSLSADGIEALVAADGWDQLRALTLALRGGSANAVAKLLDSPNVRRLVALKLAYLYDEVAEITPRVADRLARLPHLASLRLSAARIGDDVGQVLAASGSRAWQTFVSYSDPDRHSVDPNQLPPLDEELVEADQQ